MHRCVANGIVAEQVTLSVVAHLTALPQLSRLLGLSPIRTLPTRNWLSGAARVSEPTIPRPCDPEQASGNVVNHSVWTVASTDGAL